MRAGEEGVDATGAEGGEGEIGECARDHETRHRGRDLHRRLPFCRQPPLVPVIISISAFGRNCVESVAGSPSTKTPRQTVSRETARSLRSYCGHDLSFYTRLHALPRVAQGLYPEGRPSTPEETATWLQWTLASYEEFSLGHLAVQLKADGALIGRCGLTELVVETATPEHGLRKGWFGRERVPVGLALTFECELGYTFDPAVWGQGFATEAARCVRDYARDVLQLSYAVSAILPHYTRSRRVAERSDAQLAGQMDVIGRTFDRYVWPLATGGETAPQPASTKP